MVLRKAMERLATDAFFYSASTLGRLHPRANPARHHVELQRDVPYQETGLAAHRLDVYRPVSPAHAGPRPVVLYVHGGGFRILSKDSHWVMGLAFAREGYLVLNISYRLAPRHPFPAPLSDCAHAYAWAVENAARLGGDPSRLVLAGESAGANLVTALAVAACFRREEPLARRVFAAGPPPRAVLPACGLLQVTDAGRFRRRRPDMSAFAQDRILEAAQCYLPDPASLPPGAVELADPLVLLEGDRAPDRPLPPFFVGVGTRDPLLPDSRRLAAALARRGVPCKAGYYPGEMHAFHALVWRPQARRFWRDQYAFLREHVP